MMTEVSVGLNVNYRSPLETGDYASPADFGDNLVWLTTARADDCCGTVLNGVYSANRTGKYLDGAGSNADARNEARHLGGANYLLADGHVKWYAPNAVTYQANQAHRSQISSCRPPLATPSNYCG